MGISPGEELRHRLRLPRRSDEEVPCSQLLWFASVLVVDAD
ncbi:MAG TPA: hypothetical protein VMF65_22560 [Acidimicrobiales bacterium]|nr:hypothetical protein [Acidimicrobiales bacterium]